eukprot:CAMPEP_0182912204 /NCGR_PEP_ID=MMETSP0034_2-20130328/37386_1 /TAXON_ID=156128 /ORGANISM="Nephroselmis pyriformis, Strain CCMP717" /LENGTH=209 /DNA_ID=CAMNT_0025048857 /DNA_START=54 /DNA_END=683 /DNA_ORIENTATION=+
MPLAEPVAPLAAPLVDKMPEAADGMQAELKSTSVADGDEFINGSDPAKRQRNRVAVKHYRARKKAYVADLEKEVKILRAAHAMLLKKVFEGPKESAPVPQVSPLAQLQLLQLQAAQAQAHAHPAAHLTQAAMSLQAATSTVPQAPASAPAPVVSVPVEQVGQGNQQQVSIGLLMQLIQQQQQQVMMYPGVSAAAPAVPAPPMQRHGKEG